MFNHSLCSHYKFCFSQVQIPFDTYFKVEPLREYHRVMTMEVFMKKLAPTIWPPENRAGKFSSMFEGMGPVHWCN